MSVTTNKAAQEAVRGFGQAPTNYAIETAIDNVAEALGLDRIEVRRRNFIRKEEFPYLIPSGTHLRQRRLSHRGRQGARRMPTGRRCKRERDDCAQPACSPASASPRAWSRAAAIRPSSRCSIPKNTTTTWMEFLPHPCRRRSAIVTATIHTTSSGQGHETLVGTVVGEVLEIDPDLIRVVRPDSLASLPCNSPVGSRMAIMLGGAAFHAAQKLKAKLVAIGAHQFGAPRTRSSTPRRRGRRRAGERSLAWLDLVTIAHRNFHLLPPGLRARAWRRTTSMQVPTGGELPTPDGRVQMYPCHSFEFHLVLVAIDPEIGKPEIQPLRRSATIAAPSSTRTSSTA